MKATEEIGIKRTMWGRKYHLYWKNWRRYILCWCEPVPSQMVGKALIEEVQDSEICKNCLRELKRIGR